MGQLPYYLAMVAANHALGMGLARPWLFVGIAAVWLLRDRLPDPWQWAKHARRARRLAAEIAANPDNATVRRDLAMILLARRSPARAAALLAEARRIDPESAELALLHGEALFAAGRPADALGPLIAAAARNHRLRYGEAYLVAARALESLGRHAEAADALERYVGIHGSSVEAWVRLGRALRRTGDAGNAAQAFEQARRCFASAPPFRRRAERAWYLRARLDQWLGAGSLRVPTQ